MLITKEFLARPMAAPPVVAVIMIFAFISALGFGGLAWVAKNIWRDIRQTRLFAYMGIIFTMIFMALVLRYMD